MCDIRPLHLDKPKTTARAVFLDFTSAFNTFQPKLLLSKTRRKSIFIEFAGTTHFTEHRQSRSTRHIKLQPHASAMMISIFVEWMYPTCLFGRFLFMLCCYLCWWLNTTLVFIRCMQIEWWSGVRRTPLMLVHRKQNNPILSILHLPF